MLCLHHHGSINIRFSFPHGSFNEWEGGGCRKFVPVLGGDGTKPAPIGDNFSQAPDEMSGIRGKFADHVGDHAVLPPEGAISVTPSGTESSYPRPPPQSYEVSLLKLSAEYKQKEQR